ncbi:MAG: SPOR domain-containing protein [Candidatus Babeliales bacterium]
MFFKKNSPDTHEQGLFITNRHASWAVSLAIIWSFFVFISGYFLGQRAVLEQFATRLEQDSLSDKIYSSLCTLYEVDNEAEVNDTGGSSEEGEEGQSDSESYAKADTTEGSEVHSTQNPVSSVTAQAEQKDSERTKSVGKKVKHYYAPLAGFGSAEHAYAFADRCGKKNIKVTVKKKPSRSSKGRTHYWYQVVTQPYDDKQALVAVVDTIKRAEHIKDIRIREA